MWKYDSNTRSADFSLQAVKDSNRSTGRNLDGARISKLFAATSKASVEFRALFPDLITVEQSFTYLDLFQEFQRKMFRLLIQALEFATEPEKSTQEKNVMTVSAEFCEIRAFESVSEIVEEIQDAIEANPNSQRKREKEDDGSETRPEKLITNLNDDLERALSKLEDGIASFYSKPEELATYRKESPADLLLQATQLARKDLKKLAYRLEELKLKDANLEDLKQLESFPKVCSELEKEKPDEDSKLEILQNDNSELEKSDEDLKDVVGMGQEVSQEFVFSNSNEEIKDVVNKETFRTDNPSYWKAVLEEWEEELTLNEKHFYSCTIFYIFHACYVESKDPSKVFDICELPHENENIQKNSEQTVRESDPGPGPSQAPEDSPPNSEQTVRESDPGPGPSQAPEDSPPNAGINVKHGHVFCGPTEVKGDVIGKSIGKQIFNFGRTNIEALIYQEGHVVKLKYKTVIINPPTLEKKGSVNSDNLASTTTNKDKNSGKEKEESKEEKENRLASTLGNLRLILLCDIMKAMREEENLTRHLKNKLQESESKMAGAEIVVLKSRVDDVLRSCVEVNKKSHSLLDKENEGGCEGDLEKRINVTEYKISDLQEVVSNLRRFYASLKEDYKTVV